MQDIIGGQPIKSVNWIITDTCNGRCVHCDMWQSEGRRPDLDMQTIERILCDDAIRKGYEAHGKAFDISFAGGEPFVRSDLQDIVNLVERTYPGSFKAVTTNALLHDRILEFVERNQDLNFKLNVSIDGLQEVNDLQRGPGAFRKAVDLVRTVKKRFPRQKIEIKLTITPHNYAQILKVYWLAVKLGCQFTFKPVENLSSFTNSRHPVTFTFSREQICVIRNQCFKISDLMYKQGDYKKAKFYQDIPFYLAGKKMPSSCSVLNDHLTIMPGGECFFCVKEPSEGILPHNVLNDIRKAYDLEHFKCQSCMLICGPYKDYSNARFERVVANVEAINRCNLKCNFCTQKGFEDFEAQVLDLERFRRIMNDHPQITHVSFLGGESFLNKHLFDIMDFLDRKAVTYEITSNGTLFHDQMIERLKSCIGLKGILFSLDGLEECHDRQREQGTFQKCLQAIHATKDLFTVGVCSVYKADNPDEIVRLSMLLGQMGVRDHRIIYGMAHSKNTIEHSSRLVPQLVFQGPQFDEQTVDLQMAMDFFKGIEHAAQAHEMNFSYVPELFRDQTRLFLDKQLAQSGGAKCGQLEQLRFDAGGQRIICEFIRNPHDELLVNRLKEQLLPICEQCCKLKPA